VHKELLDQSNAELSGLPEMSPKLRILMTVPEAAERAGVSTWTLRQQIHQGHLVAVRIGRLLRITQAAFDAWIAQLPETGGGI
jgi:excisionase family DNA binding protein